MTVRTVLGDIPSGELGRTDYHEHLFQITPLLPGEDLDDESRSGQEAATLREAGLDAMVEATPTGLGRDLEGVARVALATGLNIVATTGAHREEHYARGHPLLEASEAGLADSFLADLAGGGTHASPPAGLLKAGIGYWSVSSFERRVLAAVGEAHRRTGAPVMVHLEHGSAAFEVLETLAAEGVSAHRVALAHIDRNPDPGLHSELAAEGAYLGYDGMARHREWPDSQVLDCLIRTAAAGGRDRLLLGGDVARRSRYRAYDGMPGIDYLPRRFVPRLRREAGPGLTDTVLRANPARWLDWRAPAPAAESD